MIYAAFGGQTLVVSDLLARGCDINHCNAEGESALSYACYNGYPDVVQLLLSCGAHITATTTNLIDNVCKNRVDNSPSVGEVKDKIINMLLATH